MSKLTQERITNVAIRHLEQNAKTCQPLKVLSKYLKSKDMIDEAELLDNIFYEVWMSESNFENDIKQL